MTEPSGGLLLTAQERDRFAAWLQLEIETSRGMLEQFEKVGGPGMDIIAKRERTKIAGFVIVLNDIHSGETFAIGGA